MSNPPSVDVPASNTHPAFSLSIATCPSNLLPLFRRWQRAVPSVQKLSTEQAHDVARLICDLEPQTSPVSTLMVKLAADVQALAIQISQRRTFMERYTQDLEIALHREMPSYQQQQYGSTDALAQYSQSAIPAQNIPAQGYPNEPPPLPTRYSPSNATNGASYDQPNIPTTGAEIPETQNEDVIAVRETLYAVLADVLSQSNTLGQILHQDPARG